MADGTSVVRERTASALALVMALLMLVACGGDDSADTATGGETGDAGSTVAEVSVPLAPGADAVATTESGPLTIVQYIVPLDRQDATIAFYDDWTAGQADDYQRTEAASGGVSWQNAPEPDGENHLIAVLSPIEGDDFVTVTLTVGPFE